MKIDVVLILEILLILFGLYLIIHLPSEHIEGKLYRFEFDAKSTYANGTDYPGKIILGDFNNMYDFTNREGYLGFYFYKLGDQKIENIELNLPGIVPERDFKALLIDENGSEIELSTSYYKTYTYGDDPQSYTRFDIESFDEYITKTHYFKISYTSDIVPKGRFSYNFIDRIQVNPPDRIGNVQFILGDKYDCQSECISQKRNIDENPWSYDRDMRLEFESTNTDGTTNFADFHLNTISRERLIQREIYIGLSVSIIVSCITLLLSRLKDYKRR